MPEKTELSHTFHIRFFDAGIVDRQIKKIATEFGLEAKIDKKPRFLLLIRYQVTVIGDADNGAHALNLINDLVRDLNEF